MALRKLIHLEYATGFIMLLLLYIHLDFSLTLFFLLLFVPDLSMIGYMYNPKTGASIYNLGHNLILPFALLGIACMNGYSLLLMIALIWVAHIFLDRALGFGLKYNDTFKQTHLQKIR